MIRSLAAAALLAFVPLSDAAADDGALLARALAQAEGGDWTSAEANGRAAGQISGLIVEWMRLRAGMGAFPEFASFAQNHPDWPGLKLLRKAGEATIGPGASPAGVIDYFAAEPPQTGTGSLALAAAFAHEGAFQKAEAEAIRAWRSLSLSESEHAEFLARYGEALVYILFPPNIQLTAISP